jgi:hypothetical protein
MLTCAGKKDRLLLLLLLLLLHLVQSVQITGGCKGFLFSP